MSFSTKFRINNKINYDKLLNIFNIDANNVIKKKTYIFSMPLKRFFNKNLNWEGISKKSLRSYLNLDFHEYQIFIRDDINFISNFHKKFVIVTVEKTSNNYAVACKIIFRQSK